MRSISRSRPRAKHHHRRCQGAIDLAIARPRRETAIFGAVVATPLALRRPPRMTFGAVRPGSDYADDAKRTRNGGCTLF